MEHKLVSSNDVYNYISVNETGVGIVEIIIYCDGEQSNIILTKKELHSFIGTLLHVQQKMK
jgi:hypothetical protein